MCFIHNLINFRGVVLDPTFYLYHQFSGVITIIIIIKQALKVCVKTLIECVCVCVHRSPITMTLKAPWSSSSLQRKQGALCRAPKLFSTTDSSECNGTETTCRLAHSHTPRSTWYTHTAILHMLSDLHHKYRMYMFDWLGRMRFGMHSSTSLHSTEYQCFHDEASNQRCL